MRIYVATGLENMEKAKCAMEALEKMGHIIGYNWTVNGDVREQSQDVWTATAREEVFAVVDAALVLILLPGGKGTHTELGIALASRNNKRIILWSETGKEFQAGENTCVFYHHMSVEHMQCSFDELLDRLRGLN